MNSDSKIAKENTSNSYIDEGGFDRIPAINNKPNQTSVENRDIEFYKTTSSDNQLNIKLDKIHPRMKMNRNSYKGGKKGKHSKITLIKYGTKSDNENYNSHLLYNPKAEKQELIDKIEELKEIQDKEPNEYKQKEEMQELMVVINKKKAMNNYFKFAEKQKRVQSGIKKTKNFFQTDNKQDNRSQSQIKNNDKFDTLNSGSQYSILNNEYVPTEVSMLISRMKNDRHSHYLNNYTIC